MTTSSTTTPDAAYNELAIPLRECAPWCIEGDGHPDEFPEDRYCRTRAQVVPLSLGEPYKEAGAWYLPSVDLYMSRERTEDEPKFSLVHDDLCPAGIRFTEAELRQLAGAALLLLDKADAARS